MTVCGSVVMGKTTGWKRRCRGRAGFDLSRPRVIRYLAHHILPTTAHGDSEDLSAVENPEAWNQCIGLRVWCGRERARSRRDW